MRSFYYANYSLNQITDVSKLLKYHTCDCELKHNFFFIIYKGISNKKSNYNNYSCFFYYISKLDTSLFKSPDNSSNLPAVSANV